MHNGLRLTAAAASLLVTACYADAGWELPPELEIGATDYVSAMVDPLGGRAEGLVEDSGDPIEISAGSINLPGETRPLVLRGGTLLVAEDGRLVDVSHPEAPEVVGALPVSPWVEGFRSLAPDTVLAMSLSPEGWDPDTGWSLELQLFDVADPAAPVLLSEMRQDGTEIMMTAPARMLSAGERAILTWVTTEAEGKVVHGLYVEDGTLRTVEASLAPAEAFASVAGDALFVRDGDQEAVARWGAEQPPELHVALLSRPDGAPLYDFVAAVAEGDTLVRLGRVWQTTGTELYGETFDLSALGAEPSRALARSATVVLSAGHGSTRSAVLQGGRLYLHLYDAALVFDVDDDRALVSLGGVDAGGVVETMRTLPGGSFFTLRRVDGGRLRFTVHHLDGEGFAPGEAAFVDAPGVTYGNWDHRVTVRADADGRALIGVDVCPAPDTSAGRLAVLAYDGEALTEGAVVGLPTCSGDRAWTASGVVDVESEHAHTIGLDAAGEVTGRGALSLWPTYRATWEIAGVDVHVRAYAEGVDPDDAPLALELDGAAGDGLPISGGAALWPLEDAVLVAQADGTASLLDPTATAAPAADWESPLPLPGGHYLGTGAPRALCAGLLGDDCAGVAATAGDVMLFVETRGLVDRSNPDEPRYWGNYILRALDLRDPTAPAFGPPLTTPRLDDAVAILGDGDAVYYAYRRGVGSPRGDDRPYARYFVRRVHLDDPAAPTLGPPISVPGAPLALAGDTLYLLDFLYDCDATTVTHAVSRVTLGQATATLEARARLDLDAALERATVAGDALVLETRHERLTFDAATLALRETSAP